MKYSIQDWAGNRPFGPLLFGSFDEAWSHIYANVDNSKYDQTQDDNDNEYQEYYVEPVNEDN